MNGSIPLTVEWAFGLLMSFILAAVWYYIKVLSDKFKAAEHDRTEIRKELIQVKLDYSTKEALRESRHEIMDLLREIKEDLKKANEKLDKKADK